MQKRQSTEEAERRRGRAQGGQKRQSRGRTRAELAEGTADAEQRAELWSREQTSSSC